MPLGPGLRNILHFGVFMVILCLFNCDDARPSISGPRRRVNSKQLDFSSGENRNNGREKKGSDFYWSGQDSVPYLWNLPNFQHSESFGNVKVPFYHPSQAWTWGDEIKVQVADDDSVQLLPVGFPVRLPNGGYHQNNIIVKKPDPVNPQYMQAPEPVQLSAHELMDIVNSLKTPPINQQGETSSTSVKSPITLQHNPLTIKVQNSNKHITVQGSGGHGQHSNTISSTLTVRNPDDPSDLTLLHGSILVSKKRKPQVPVVLPKPVVTSQTNKIHQSDPSNEQLDTKINFVSQAGNTQHLIDLLSLQTHDDLFDLSVTPSVPVVPQVNLFADAADSNNNNNNDFVNINSVSLTQGTQFPPTIGSTLGELISTTPSLPDEDVAVVDEFLSANVASTDESESPSDDLGPFLIPNKELVLPQLAEEDDEPPPDIQPLLASFGPPAQGLVASQIVNLPSVASANAFLNVPPVSSFSTGNAITTSNGNVISTSNVFQFIVQILVPVIIVLGIVYFLIVVTTSGRRRRRDLSSSSLDSFLKLPDGFPLDLLGR